MEKHMQEQSETQMTGKTPQHRPSRRAFMVTGTAAIAAIGLWSLHKSSPVPVEAATAGAGTKIPELSTFNLVMEDDVACCGLPCLVRYCAELRLPAGQPGPNWVSEQ